MITITSINGMNRFGLKFHPTLGKHTTQLGGSRIGGRGVEQFGVQDALVNGYILQRKGGFLVA